MFLSILLAACLEEVILLAVVPLAVFHLFQASLGQVIPVQQAEQAFLVEVLLVKAFLVETLRARRSHHLMLALVFGDYLRNEILTSNCSESYDGY